MGEPLVTIGIPFYNDEKFLESAIRSVLNQTYKNWELILIDDGSSDNSLIIANKYKSSRVSIISDGNNKGLARRLNELSKMAKGQYYARMDADDIMHYSRIKEQVSFLQNNMQVDLVGTSAYIIDAKDKIIGRMPQCTIINPRTIQDILNGGGFIHPSIMGKTEWFQKNPYDEKLKRNQDLGLWIKTVGHSNFQHMEEPLLFYRMMGSHSLKKELRSFKSNRHLYFGVVWNQMKQKKLGLALFVKSFAKLVIRIFIVSLGLKKFLATSRYLGVSGKEYSDALIELNKSK